MVASLWFCSWGGLVTLLPFFVSSALVEDCISPRVFPHFVTNDMQQLNGHMCNRCYDAPTSQRFQVKLHKVRLRGMSTMMIYVDGMKYEITQDCGMCDSDTVYDSKGDIVDMKEYDGNSDTMMCQECETIANGIVFEVYLRVNSKVQISPEAENFCQDIADVNISLSMKTEKPEIGAPSDCYDGFMVSFPLGGDTCIINSTFLGTETRCLVPTCADGIISSDGSNEKTEHKFKPFTSPETCVWQLNTEQRKHVTLRFSLNIRPHLTVFEESLMNPKWDVEWCPTYNNDFKIVTDADTVFIVYHSTNKFSKKRSLSITTQTDLCLLPPSLANGSVEFKRLESGTVAFYSCDKGFSLYGPSELQCKSGDWDEPPVCLHLNTDKLMSDAPMASREILDGLNVSVLTTDNGTFLASSADSDSLGKMPVIVKLDQDPPNDNKNDDYGGEEVIDTAEEPVMVEEMHMNTSVISVDDHSNDTTDSFTINGTESVEEGMVVMDNGKENEDNGILTGLFNLFLEEDMTLYVIIGATGLISLIIVTIISVVIYRKRYPVRLGLGRKFDTFQNPIYEKTVVRMPMQVEDTEIERKRSDAEEMSDCTVLE